MRALGWRGRKELVESWEHECRSQCGLPEGRGNLTLPSGLLKRSRVEATLEANGAAQDGSLWTNRRERSPQT